MPVAYKNCAAVVVAGNERRTALADRRIGAEAAAAVGIDMRRLLAARTLNDRQLIVAVVMAVAASVDERSFARGRNIGLGAHSRCSAAVAADVAFAERHKKLDDLALKCARFLEIYLLKIAIINVVKIVC